MYRDEAIKYVAQTLLDHRGMDFDNPYHVIISTESMEKLKTQEKLVLKIMRLLERQPNCLTMHYRRAYEEMSADEFSDSLGPYAGCMKPEFRLKTDAAWYQFQHAIRFDVILLDGFEQGVKDALDWKKCMQKSPDDIALKLVVDDECNIRIKICEDANKEYRPLNNISGSLTFQKIMSYARNHQGESFYAREIIPNQYNNYSLMQRIFKDKDIGKIFFDFTGNEGKLTAKFDIKYQDLEKKNITLDKIRNTLDGFTSY